MVGGGVPLSLRLAFHAVSSFVSCKFMPKSCLQLCLERLASLCASRGGLVGGVARTAARPAHHVDGLPLPSKETARAHLGNQEWPGRS